MMAGLGRFTQQSGAGAYTGPYTLADWDALDAYVVDLASALRALGYHPTTVEDHPNGGAGYNYFVSVAEFPNYSHMITIARFLQFGTAAGEAAAFVRDATAMASIPPDAAAEPQPVLDDSNSYLWPDGARRLKIYGVPPSTSVASTGTGASTVVESIVNQATGAAAAIGVTGLSSIPTWVWLAGGAAALYFFMGRGK